MGTRVMGLALAAALVLPSLASAAPRCKSGKRPEVFVRPKTPIRRGPGLNYQVSRFLERGRCLPFSEVSVDQNWVLIDQKETIGWVPVNRLNKRSQEKVSAAPRKPAPVGSAQARTITRVSRRSMLLEQPNAESNPRRVLPRDIEVVPLAMTDDGRWVQVRDERGDVGWVLMTNLSSDALADLPVLEDGFNRGVSGAAGPSRSVETAGGANTAASEMAADVARDLDQGSSFDAADLGASDAEGSRLIGEPATTSEGVGVTGFVLAGAVVPSHRLDSDAELGRRRYNLSAVSPAVAIQLELTDLGPVTVRAGYLFGLLLGVGPENEDSAGLGQQHQGVLRVGLPLAVGSVLVTPELGYSFGWFDFDSILPDDPQVFTVVSNQAHMGSAGARAQWMAARSVLLEGEAAFLAGATFERPRDLGKNSLALGFEGGLAAHFLIDDRLGLVTRYMFRLRRAGFTGGNGLDPTLTEATLTDVSHGLVFGVSFVL